MLLSEGFVLLEPSHPNLKQEYETFSLFCCSSLSVPQLLDQIVSPVPHMKAYFSHQTVSGPRSCAACSTMLITTVAR